MLHLRPSNTDLPLSFNASANKNRRRDLEVKAPCWNWLRKLGDGSANVARMHKSDSFRRKFEAVAFAAVPMRRLPFLLSLFLPSVQLKWACQAKGAQLTKLTVAVFAGIGSPRCEMREEDLSQVSFRYFSSY